MATVCIICSSACSQENVQIIKIQRFFDLLERHLNNRKPNDPDHYTKLLTEMLLKGNNKSGLAVCKDCSTRMDSFCEDYCLMKSMELIVNGRLWAFREIMMTSSSSQQHNTLSSSNAVKEQQASSSSEKNQSYSKSDDDNDLISLIISYKRTLIKRCSQKLSSNLLPKISIRKWCPPVPPPDNNNQILLSPKKQPATTTTTTKRPTCKEKYQGKIPNEQSTNNNSVVVVVPLLLQVPHPPTILQKDNTAEQEPPVKKPIMKLEVPTTTPLKNHFPSDNNNLFPEEEEDPDEDYYHQHQQPDDDDDNNDHLESDIQDNNNKPPSYYPEEISATIPVRIITTTTSPKAMIEEEERNSTSNSPKEQEASSASPPPRPPQSGKRNNKQNGQLLLLDEHQAAAALLFSKYSYFKCPHCELLFSEPYKLLLHIEEKVNDDDSRHHPNNPEEAPLSVVMMSLETDTRSRPQPDTLNVNSSKILQVTGTILLQPKVFHCSFVPACQQLFYSEAMLADHLSSHHDDSNNPPVVAAFNLSKVCAICQRKFTMQSKVAIHYLTHHDVSHRRRNDNSSPRRCQITGCTAYFYIPRHLKAHYRLEHPSVDKLELKRLLADYSKVSCVDCNNKLFCNLDELKSHRLRFHVANPLFCSLSTCLFICETEEQLQNHMKLQHKPGLEYLSCPTCQKQFASAGYLKGHMKSHEEKAPHICEQCGKVFAAKDNYQNHLLSHSGPESWKFVCEICSKRCMSVGKLKEHMRTHGNDDEKKRFVCQVCGVRYAHRHNLRIHVNSKHGDVEQDVAKTYKRTNLTSQKGIRKKQKIS